MLVRHAAVALGCCTLVAVALTGPALLGRAALGPDSVLDTDALYRIGPAPPPPPTNDFTPIYYDLPRDLAVARGFRAGRLDTWNPLVGFGAPLWAEQGAPGRRPKTSRCPRSIPADGMLGSRSKGDRG